MSLIIDHQEDAFLNALKEHSTASGELQQRAQQALKDLPLPTKKWEDWKYTQVKELLQQSYTTEGLPVDHIDDFLIPGLEGDRLVFLNGRFSPTLSSIGNHGDFLHVAPMHALSDLLSGVYASHFGELISDNNLFTAANTAYAEEGVVMFVPNGITTIHPIQILHLQQPGQEALASQHRNLFVVGKQAEVKVVETYFSIGQGHAFSNQVDEVFVLEGGDMTYVKIQSESDQSSHMSHTEVAMSRDSRLRMYTHTFSGEIVRNNLHLHLGGENVNAQLNGAYLLGGQQHVDNYTKVDHAMPNCYSNELYKGIITDRATGVFSGYIHVWPDAQKTNAFQSNRNILLSDNANMYTKPQLEIYADDVKCSHGATTGRIDEIALFYLRARGIPELEAKKIMIHAFIMETLEHMDIAPVFTYLEERVSSRF